MEVGHERVGIKRGFLASRREEIIASLYEQVRALETRYTKLYEGSPDMYRTIDKDGFIIDCNRAYIENLGYSSKGEVIGHSMFEHTAEETLMAMRQSFEEWQKNGRVTNKEVRLKKKDGTTFPALINASTLHDDNGKIIGSNTVITDMTEINKTRHQLQEANEGLKKSQEQREDFIRIAAHDLRTPIQPILGMAELGLRDPSYQKEALSIILKEAKRLKQLANDLLDVAKIESGAGLQFNLKKVKATDVINEIIDYAKLCVIKEIEGSNKNNDARPVRIVDSLLHDDNLMLEIDRDRIVQALTNVMDNSLKFTEEGQIKIETAMPNGSHFLELTISDTGAGIPQEVLPKLFQKFATKTPNNPGKKFHSQGTGLGLFISRSIINAHGGEISARGNSDSKGAAFVIRLPIPSN
jgi:PAS domain S-box-containing protein